LWRLKYRIEGKEKLLAIGPDPEVSLAKARDRRDDAKKAIVDGVDPSALKKRAREEAKAAPVNTFRAVAEEHLAKLTREGLAERGWSVPVAMPQSAAKMSEMHH
ncbi:Arm DNA-binding domain-containing protein, partial [Enterobacter cloacae complex sp.6730737]